MPVAARVWLVAVGLALVGACGDGGAGSGGADTGPAADTSDVAGTTTDADGVAVSACSADDRAACLYEPEARYEVGTIAVPGLTYTDRIGATRTVNALVHRPKGAPTPAPVVLLSHGGSGGKTDPSKSMDVWAHHLAEAGYVAVAIAHEGRDDAAYRALCTALGIPADRELCGIKINWDRPHDVARVLAWLDEQVADGALAGAVDLGRLAHVGHSAGAGAAMMLAGAPRNFVCSTPFGTPDAPGCDASDLVSLENPRFRAVVAMSPQGPGDDGFMAESFEDIAVPMLVGTGQRDGDPGVPENREQAYALAPPGGRYLLYVDDPGAKHTLFEGEVDACADVSGQARCERMRAWILAAGLAFLDAELRDRPEARAWLASADVVTAADGDVRWERK